MVMLYLLLLTNLINMQVFLIVLSYSGSLLPPFLLSMNLFSILFLFLTVILPCILVTFASFVILSLFLLLSLISYVYLQTQPSCSSFSFLPLLHSPHLLPLPPPHLISSSSHQQSYPSFKFSPRDSHNLSHCQFSLTNFRVTTNTLLKAITIYSRGVRTDAKGRRYTGSLTRRLS